ncbi:MAG: squalene/phytoene synthase family protein [candidate division Zixibacteria bacterium]|nr:squalene/phytoene synthase family protein [candidate division Zixibacteria bacterium]
MDTNKPTKIDFAAEIDFSEILTNPILDIAAQFWDNDRYDAFRVCYRSMRVLDDLVDNRKEAGSMISARERELLGNMIDDWLNSLHRKLPTDQFQKHLLKAIDHYRIPIWPWERLARAMKYDLNHDGFTSILVFLRYCEGAAIAPASIFTHLCGVTPSGDDFLPPSYDVRLAARSLALFSYFVHIMRDFQKDQQAGLNYIVDNMLAIENVSRGDLQKIANGSPIDDRFRRLMARYAMVAEYYRLRARSNLDRLLPQLTPRYQLSLEVIYGLYLQIFQRVRPSSGMFTSEELNPTPEEVKGQLDRIVSSFEPL